MQISGIFNSFHIRKILALKFLQQRFKNLVDLSKNKRVYFFLVHGNNITYEYRYISKLNTQLRKMNHIGWYTEVRYREYILGNITNISQYMHKTIL